MVKLLPELTANLPMIFQILVWVGFTGANVLIFLNREKIVLSDIFRRKTVTSKHTLLLNELFTLYSSRRNHISHISVGDPDTSKIYQIIINNKHDAMVKHLEELVKNSDVYSATKAQLHGMIINKILDIFNDYDEKNRIELGDDIYDLVVGDPRKGFNALHEKVLQNMFLYIKDMILDTNKLELSNAEIIGVVVDLSKNALDVAIDDTKDLFRNFNGNLHSLIEKQKLKHQDTSSLF